MVPIVNNVCVYICRPDALKGSLVHTLKKAKPTLSVAVPRLYEKMAEQIKKKYNESSVREDDVQTCILNNKFIHNEKLYSYTISNESLLTISTNLIRHK